jgi:CubicO group peptidase (beta-lactamase class C family)
VSLPYFPEPDSGAGWRRTLDDRETRESAGFDPDRLKIVELLHLSMHQGPWAIVVVRRGLLVREWYAIPGMPGTTYDLRSSTKSVTGIAFGILLEDSRQRRLPDDRTIDLESTAYDYLPEGQPLTDPLKQEIKLKHLLAMTSGIPGEREGIWSAAVLAAGQEYEFALGRRPNKLGFSAAKLVARPGAVWDYSDAAFAHLSLIFRHASGSELEEFLQRRVLKPLGIVHSHWDASGGAGGIGPHTNAHSGLHLSARDFARLGYLMLNRGAWDGEQIVPESWIELSTKSSQELNASYGYTFWVNSDGALWPSVPRDAFAFRGYASTRCYVVPSLDLVVVRLGYAPPMWEEGELLPSVVEAIIG